VGLIGTTADDKKMVGFTTTATTLCVGLVDPARNFAMGAKNCSTAAGTTVTYASMSPDRSRLVVGGAGAVLIMRVSGQKIVTDFQLRNTSNISDNFAVWETDNLIDLFAVEQIPTPGAVRLLQCRADDGRCRERETGYSAVGTMLISNLAPRS
jgi:hypothetical protein